MKTASSWNWDVYLQASAAGAARGLFGLPIEHPFDRVKTGMQANPTRGAVGTVQDIFATSGWRGFYTGVIPNGTRAAVKQLYRWPMMVALPPIYKSQFPDAASTKVKTAVGLTIANFEVGVIAPLEKLKVELMTAPKEERSIPRFVTGHFQRQTLLQTLYKGTTAVWARQNVSWVSFLVADDYFKKVERAKYPDQELPYPALMKVAAEVGVVNTMTNMPFDAAKTRLQAHESSFKGNVFKAMGQIFKESGVRGLYAGWGVRMAHYMVHSIFTVNLLEVFEQQMRKRADGG